MLRWVAADNLEAVKGFRRLKGMLTQAGSRLQRELADSMKLELAGSTGLEPAASGVTGRRSNQLNYDPD